jgi:hypothetical protein
MRIPTNTGEGGGEDTAIVDEMFPQARAAGKGGAGIRSVAAPPTRSVRDFSDRQAQGRYIEPTPEEFELSQLLYEQINGRPADNPAEAVRWYHAGYNSPSAQRKLKRWAQMGR